MAGRHADQLEDAGLDLAPAQAGDLLQQAQAYTKKERLELQRERDKLIARSAASRIWAVCPTSVRDRHQGGHRDQGSAAAQCSVAAVVDTNCNPDGITFVVPGNDDASRAITLCCDLTRRAAIDGISRAQGDMGIDVARLSRWWRCRPRPL
jgi:small subunit ribosomal protein S2